MRPTHRLSVLALAALLVSPPTPAATRAGPGISVTLTRVFQALPPPSKRFRLDAEGGSRTIEIGHPTRAHEVRVYEQRTGSGDTEGTTTVEVRVTINGDLAFPDPFASESGTPRAFTHDGLPATRTTLAGAEDSRVAMPLNDEQRANVLTDVRLLVGPASAQVYLDAVAKGHRPEKAPWDGRSPKGANEIRVIVVEYYGPRAEVERLLAATKAAPLRALLSSTL